jgi:hypothetical protein
MGIQIEFSPELALRDIAEFKKGKRKKEECIPEKMQKGKIYSFIKKGQRVYWFNDEAFWSNGEMPLVKTDGTGKTTRPVAGIKMIEATHFINKGEIFTKGKYKALSVFDPKDQKIKFESVRRIK